MKFLGSTVEIVSDAEVARAVREIPCAALVLDMDSLPEDKIFSLGQEIQQAGSVVPPLIFLSSQGDLASRLLAVRAGGALYFTKPVETETLNEALEKFISLSIPNSCRVLIIEDDPILAASYGLTLKQAGMVTATVTDPLRAMEVLAEFKPELILMDLYMDGCSGMELAKVIRQQVAFVGVPIVFLSSEADPIKQLLALGLGGDDFLTKPVAPERLIASVSIRAERLRTLRALMTRDSLTGLANHTEILAHLERELARARRNRSSLTFAMIDIDHFKRVNDTYGHPVGDKVIQSLARLFKLRLRHSDFAGRYGGEEFAVVLPDTDRHGAFKILDELRACFSQMTQSCDQGNFLVSFSCGFATFPAHQSVTELIEAADEVLYRAKNAGRDRTEF
jgi:diguanylate cyclase (GGDEF)-like protein